ncbi:uncharacterized protein SCHCODRAFT_01170835 [Schizophyllum commune H4-8]|nr:uncharacterized protein SCHCODRAFT_01170835 [Schizophyllum commune H4-8]KAI5896788.1 hypothetical protein SCHCODRAFT_01170835 [Schizophyllum commune H4-8]
MLADPNYFDAILHTLPRVRALLDQQAAMSAEVEALARMWANTAQQEPLYQLRSETQESFSQAKALEARWKELEKEQRDVYQRFTPQFLLMRLRHATTAQDDLSETLANTFVSSSAPTSSTAAEPHSGTNTPVGTLAGKDIDDFVREYRELRKVYHKRMIWGEKWGNGDVEWRDD